MSKFDCVKAIINNDLSWFQNNSIDALYDNEKNSLLQLAITSKTPTKIMDLIFEKTKELNHQNLKGETALITSVKTKNIKIAQALLEKGCDHELHDQKGHTALHHAIILGDEEMVEMLLKHKCNKYVTDFQGNSCMDLAEENGNQKIINLLKIFIQNREKTGSFWNKVKNTINFTVEKEKHIFEYLKSHKFNLEKHECETQDGYILQIVRLKRKNAPVVFLQHGLFNSCATWVITEQDSLAFMLYNAGYDVWIGNNRGTTFSRKHKELHDRLDEYWIWSWQELAQFDFPTQINYVLKVTEKEKINYIGHSQGTTQAFAGLLLNSDLQDKIELFIGLAPAISLEYQSSISYKFISQIQTDRILSPLSPLLQHEVAPVSISRTILPQLAKTLGHLNDAWSYMMDCDIDMKYLNNLTKSEPSPTSFTNLLHWTQLCRAGKFRGYDHGKEMNLIKYKSEEPPIFEISKIKTNIALFYGELDALITPKEIEKNLIPNLKNVIYSENVKNFKHNDFVWGKKAKEMVYIKILDMLHKNNKHMNLFQE